MIEEAQHPRAELFFAANNLVDKDVIGKSDPFLVLFSKNEAGAWVEIGRTDVIQNNLNPVWLNRFVVDYHFELVQEFKVAIYDEDVTGERELSWHELLGENTFKLGSLMAARGQRLTMQLVKASQGTVTIRAEPATNSRDTFRVQFAAAGLPNKGGCFRTSSPFIAASRLREDNTWLQVWRNEAVHGNLSPTWELATVSLQELCNGDADRPMKFEIFDEQNGRNVLMGSMQASVRQLVENLVHVYPLQSPPDSWLSCLSSSGTLTCRVAEIKHHPTFMQYVKGGCQLSLMVAIDFTASNGDPKETWSLHHIDPSGQRLNEYQHAIVSVDRVLDEYDSDKKYPVYGFGAQLRNSDKTSHCFYVCRNGEKEAKEVQGVDGILQAYDTCRYQVKFSAPTLFAPILRKAMDRASASVSQSQQQYHILLILCDGSIHDMEDAIEALVEASRLPLSVVIVGVGGADFAAMHDLDSDDKLLHTKNGATAARDIVQFIPFRKYGTERPTELAREVLAEIPSQLVGYMAQAGIAPNVPGGTVPSVEEFKQSS